MDEATIHDSSLGTPTRRESLSPMVCPGCGSPLAHGDGDTTRCPACGRDVPVPPEHLALHEAWKTDESTRRRAVELAAQLTAPPGRWMRFWLRAGTASFQIAFSLGAVWVIASVILGFGRFFRDVSSLDNLLLSLCARLIVSVPLLFNQALHAMARWTSVDRADVWGGAGAYARLGLLFFVAFALPMILMDYADGFEATRATLRKILSAKPPRTPGGAYECRTCGAALVAAPGALHANCMYCRADNFVALPPQLLEKAKSGAAEACASLAEAIASERRASVAGRWRAARRLAISFVTILGVTILLGRAVQSETGDGPTFWQPASADAPLLPSLSDNPRLARGAEMPFTVHKTFDACDERICRAYYFARLEHGERLRVTAVGGALSLTAIEERDLGRWYDPQYGWRARDMAEPAPYTGWYRVTLSQPRGHAREPRVRWETYR